MTETYEIEIDHLSMGLTKPPTQFGVPLIAFYSNIVMCFLGWTMLQAIFQQMLSITLFFLIVFVVMHLAMAWMTFRDPYGLSLFWLNLTQFKQHPTYSRWNNTDSYTP